ncbi:MAG: biotin synthase BioB [Bacteroidota bacterium]|nr:biotin synthase BioB [Bacteroidota bacterium]MDP4232308.1 biotin synthase BioB [Bacteroidota bacterium]MDP4241447.1 biotin synthase BioB [Bacteroidota bacterium]MDP4286729.1 biotin synthase BioB [Bacteroidota bacterium]
MSVSLEYVRELYKLPFLQLVAQASAVHRAHHNYDDIQLCTLLSIKTGGCPEDCAYCPQAARYHTGVEVQKLMDVERVLCAAREAKENGSTRFCMGAAWREVRDNSDFDRVLDMVRGVREMGMEVCTTLGMVTASQAERLKEAGLTAYNHNLDTSDSFYGQIIHTREYADRLNTLQNVQHAGISVCCGGILGMGETDDDRIAFLHTLANLDPYPESVPINALVPVEGTPLADQPPVTSFEFVRTIACARILMPKARVRLSAGRLSLSEEAQTLAFLAGANSIFTGEKLLTTGNPGFDQDHSLLAKLGVSARKPYASEFSITA